MARSNELKLRINIHGFTCSPERISDLIGLNPSRVWLKDESVVPGSLNKNEQNGWQICSPLDENHTLDEHWIALESVFERIAEKRPLLPSEIEIEVSCVIYVYESVPSIFFNHAQITLLEKIGAELDIDLYCMMD